MNSFFDLLKKRLTLSPAQQAGLHFFIAGVVLLVGNSIPQILSAIHGTPFAWGNYLETTLISAALLAAAKYFLANGETDIAEQLRQLSNKESGQNIQLSQLDGTQQASAANTTTPPTSPQTPNTPT